MKTRLFSKSGSYVVDSTAAMFHTVPLTGAVVVVATGLFTLYRESRLRIRPRVVPDRIR